LGMAEDKKIKIIYSKVINDNLFSFLLF